jgi:hypothetical protein
MNLNGTKQLTKKQARKIVFQKLSSALVEYKHGLKEKKLNRSLKKLSKDLAADIVKAEKQNGKFTKKEGKPIDKTELTTSPSFETAN